MVLKKLFNKIRIALRKVIALTNHFFAIVLKSEYNTKYSELDYSLAEHLSKDVLDYTHPYPPFFFWSNSKFGITLSTKYLHVQINKQLEYVYKIHEN